jgi:hypothetical protein
MDKNAAPVIGGFRCATGGAITMERNNDRLNASTTSDSS